MSDRLPHKVAREIARELRPLGFSASKTRGNHIRFTHAGGGFFVTPGSPHDWQQTRKMVRSYLRRMGVSPP
jgi:predicted RNA binding protein YcfA (HicA-like mRNA interferase family)